MTGVVTPLHGVGWTLQRRRDQNTEVIWQPAGLAMLADLPSLAQLANQRVFLVTDTHVASLYGAVVQQQLRHLGARVSVLTIPPGEESKTLGHYGELAAKVVTQGVDSASWIVGLGGGVVCNLAGFLAGTVHRGLALLQLPTTLLAQIDATIDFKQGVNLASAKNQLGCYYAASVVVVDPTTLSTLPARQLRSGMAEAIKHALAEDREMYEALMMGSSLEPNSAQLARIALRTIELKADTFSADADSERGELLPQYGHTVGHALEQASRYELLHGEALAIGMRVMADVAVACGLASHGLAEAHERVLELHELPTQVPVALQADEILDAMTYDKHFRGGEWEVALIGEVGELAPGPAGWGHWIGREVFRKSLIGRRASG